MSIAHTLKEAWEANLLSSRWKSGPTRDYVYASRRRPCVRCMALDLTNADDEPEWEPDALERVTRGKEREEAIVARLIRVGARHDPPFTVVEGQSRFEIKDRDGTILIVGKIDGMLQLDDGTKMVFEIKSGRTFENVDRIEDFEKSIWTRHALDQLLAYMYSHGQERGLFILDRHGVPAFIEVRLEDHLQRVEQFLQEARKAVDWRFGRGELPPIPKDLSFCEHCPHYQKSCFPPEYSYGPGDEVITDEEVIRMLEERGALEPSAKRYKELDSALKKMFRGVRRAIAGPWEIRGSTYTRVAYKVPDEIKEQYAYQTETVRLTIKRRKGA